MNLRQSVYPMKSCEYHLAEQSIVAITHSIRMHKIKAAEACCSVFVKQSAIDS